MTSLALVLPEATENLVTNPSVEAATTGYTGANGATLTRVATAQRRGVYSLNVAPTAAVNDGVYWGITLIAATEYALSFDFKGQDKIPYRAYLYDVTGAVILGQPLTFTGDDQWHRYEFTQETGANTSHRLYIVKNNHADTGAFQIDGVQIEAKSFATTYCDGDQPGCEWSGAAHASASTRNALTRAGGRVVDPEDEFGLAIETLSGLGVPPNILNSVSYSQLPGGFLNSIKVESRTMQFGVVTISEDEETLYAARRQLINALSQARFQTAQPILLRYKRTEREIEIPVYYDSGLEGRFEELYEKIPLRLIAYDPYFKETSEEGAALNMTISGLASTKIFKWVDGVWSVAIPGMTTSGDVLNTIVDMRDGTWVVVGTLTAINGDTDQTHIARYNPATETFTDIATGGANGGIGSAGVAPDGTLYVLGNFTTIGGVAATRIAKYSSGTWSALGSGLNGIGRCIGFDTDGLPVVGGDFTTANGVTVNGIAKWTGATFTGFGATPGISAGTNSVSALQMIPGTSAFYVGGNWTTMDGVANTTGLAKWSGTAWVALSSQGGVTGGVIRLKYGPDRKLYIGGNFTALGGVTTTNVARYNGSFFEGINAQLSGGSVNGMSFDSNGFMWVSGNSQWGNWPTIIDTVGRWDGTVFRTPFIDFPTTVVGLTDAPDGGMWVTASSTGGVASPAPQTTIAYNGDIPGYPIIKIKRTGGTSATLYGIRNLTTGVELLFNVAIFDGEEIAFDLSQTSKLISSNFRGDNFVSYLPGSKVTGFNLINGENLIEVYIVSVGGPTLTGTMRWRNQYESVDGAIL